MGTFQRIKEDNPSFDFKDRFSIRYFCPRNKMGIIFSLNWLTKVVVIDWATLFLAVGGGYLSYRSIFDYALNKLNDDDDDTVQNLALMSYDECIDKKESDRLIEKILNGISLEEWALGFMKLFFITIKWFCSVINPNEKQYQQEFDSIFFDFCLIELPDADLCFPYSSVGNVTEDIDKKRKLREDYDKAADKYLSFLNSVDPYCRDFAPFLNAVKNAWNHYGLQGSKPSNAIW